MSTLTLSNSQLTYYNDVIQSYNLQNVVLDKIFTSGTRHSVFQLQGMRADFNRCFPLKSIAAEMERLHPGGAWKAHWTLKNVGTSPGKRDGRVPLPMPHAPGDNKVHVPGFRGETFFFKHDRVPHRKEFARVSVFFFQPFKCSALHPLFGDKVTRIVWDANARSKRTNYHKEKIRRQTNMRWKALDSSVRTSHSRTVGSILMESYGRITIVAGGTSPHEIPHFSTTTASQPKQIADY